MLLFSPFNFKIHFISLSLSDEVPQVEAGQGEGEKTQVKHTETLSLFFHSK